MAEPKIEPISFSKGVITGKSPLMLVDGELVSSSGHLYDVQGEITVRPSMGASNTTAVGSINGIHRYTNTVFLTDTNARYKWDLDGYCDLYTPANGDFTNLGTLGSTNRSKWTDAENFTFMVNGFDSKAFSSNLMYEWSIENPVAACYGAAGAAGNPSGTYTLYYTFYVLFPNGTAYETGPSPAVEVTVTNQKIAWTSIGVCPYSGSGLKIYRRLYRYSSGLADTYYVTTLTDNTTTTYTDDNSDATVGADDVLGTTYYGPAPSKMTDICTYLFRIFGIKNDSVYYSEAYLPFTFATDSSLAICNQGEVLKSCVQWGDQLYIGWPRTWKRIQGTDPTTWSVKNTFSEQGPINPHTTKKTRYGIIFQWYDGIYLFDGTVSRNLTDKPLGTALFENIVNPSLAYAEFNGRRYHLIYASTSTTLDKHLVLDFENFPNVKSYNYDTEFIPSAYEYHFPTGIEYWGKTNGYQYYESGSETIASSLQTGDKVLGGIVRLKNTDRLYYDIDTSAKDVTITLYSDGIACSPTYTINESTRKRSSIPLGNHQGYRFSIKVTCANARSLIIYEPWGISYTPYGG